ncbi:Hypothetical predicted protein [Mytilus galloprovincialis]|uniref:Retrotransposon gag domain-containing protein n=1 Tax=Mytilus galloprovincialis TaxID=29158 RepID=A0A8B6C0X1_MYTGA|nr:Hypothetical predicted protein [Mytilus galloprovincialis]
MPLNRPTNYVLRSAGLTDLEPITEENNQQEVAVEIKVHQQNQQPIMNNAAEAVESNEQACNALKFYLEGSSKLWYEGITDEIQNDFDALQAALIERFKNADEDDDILLAQLPTEKAVEYLDRIQIKARH